MAGIIASAVTAEVSTGTSAKTLLQLVAAANHRVKLLRWGIAFDGIAPTAAPILVRLLRQTTAGTMSALTPTLLGVGSETLQTTAQHTASAEPTAGDVLDQVEVHPQTGFEILFPLGQEILIPGGGRLGLEVTAGESVNAIAKFVYEE